MEVSKDKLFWQILIKFVERKGDAEFWELIIKFLESEKLTYGNIDRIFY